MEPEALTTAEIINIIIYLLPIIIWELYWKGVGLWRAAKLDHQKWFIAILILNTLGILPIIYLLILRNKKSKSNSKK